MKKSKLYELAALAVIRDTIMSSQTRLDIITELLDRKHTEEIIERANERKEAENGEGESN